MTISVLSDPETCTITATCKLNKRVEVIDLAKHFDFSDATHDPDGRVLCIRMSYADNQSILKCRPDLDMRKHKFCRIVKEFSKRQVSIFLESGTHYVCCKVFTTGSMHVAGARSEKECLEVFRYMARLVASVRGCAEVPTFVGTNGIRLSEDGIMYHPTRKSCPIVGWCLDAKTGLFQLSDGVRVYRDVMGDVPVLKEIAYKRHQKMVYTLQGDLLATETLKFHRRSSKRFFKVLGEHVVVGQEIVGNVVYTPVGEMEGDHGSNGGDKLPDRLTLIHHYAATDGPPDALTKQDVDICMVNTYCVASFPPDRTKLHELFLELGYDSRLDLCVNPGVNLRYHDNRKHFQEVRGICTCPSRCTCKIVAIRCFRSGEVIAAGLLDEAHGTEIHGFLDELLSRYQDRVMASTI